jgi:hypothetical protein
MAQHKLWRRAVRRAVRSAAEQLYLFLFAAIAKFA